MYTMYVHTNCRTVPPGIYGICKVFGDFQIIEYGRLNFRHSEMYRIAEIHITCQKIRTHKTDLKLIPNLYEFYYTHTQ